MFVSVSPVQPPFSLAPPICLPQTGFLFSGCASGSAWDRIVVMLLYVCTAIVVRGRIGSVGEDDHVEIVEIL